jgi:S1-C subfamily serine protease
MSVGLPAHCRLIRFLLFPLLLAFGAGQSFAETAGRAWVGIDISDIATAQLRELRVVSGVLVLLVREDSPASLAGLMEGDVVVQVDGEPIGSAQELVCAIMKRLPGSVVGLETIRATKGRVVLVTLGNWPHALDLPAQHCPMPIARTS